MEVLQIQQFTYSIGKKKILSEVNLSLSLQDTVAIRGENGAGKSTLLKNILHWKKFSPSIQIHQNQPNRVPLSYLGHSLGLYGALTMSENLQFFRSLSPNPYPWKKIQEWGERLFLTKRWDDPVYTLSRGMKQKVGILRAISIRPTLLLLDEPFTGLDEKSYPIVLEIFQEISQDMAILAVLHGYESKFWGKNYELKMGCLEKLP